MINLPTIHICWSPSLGAILAAKKRRVEILKERLEAAEDSCRTLYSKINSLEAEIERIRPADTANGRES